MSTGTNDIWCVRRLLCYWLPVAVWIGLMLLLFLVPLGSIKQMVGISSPNTDRAQGEVVGSPDQPAKS